LNDNQSSTGSELDQSATDNSFAPGLKGSLSKIAYNIFGLKKGSELKPTEAFSYGIAGFGQNLICGFIGSSYLVYFFTNGLLLNATVVGFIMLFTRLFDAFNDPVMGSIVDRTRTKWGKCRPYLLFTPIPIAILTVLIFLPLTPSTVSTAVVATLIYVLWSVIYTIVDVPYWGLATQMTSDTHLRGNILTVARLFCTIGSGVISIAVPPLISGMLANYLDADGEIMAGFEYQAAEVIRDNFIWIAVAIAALSIYPFFLGFLKTNERYYSTEKPKSLKHNIGLIFKNKPLLIIICSGVLGCAKIMFMYSGLYFCVYALGNVNFLGMHGSGLFTMVTLSIVPGGLLASVLTPYCTRKFGKRKTFIVSHLFGGIVLIIIYFIGYDTTWKLIVAMFGLMIAAIPQGFGNIISYAMIADSVDYLELHHNERGEGICFAMQTFINKVGMAFGAAVTAFGLDWAHIQAGDITSVTTQGKNTLWMLTILMTALSLVLSTIPMFFYKFNEKEQQEAVAQIAARKLALQDATTENVGLD
jgi:sugar (glycoside-pentoside-hexuronide) transporter